VKTTAVKNKIINDPLYGFISINDPLILAVIDHPWFQRLRRIKQLGLTSFVYPGALHTRFHHAIGAMHLMNQCLDVLSSKGALISDEERRAALLAILLHDIGHGPFSHALEGILVNNAHHEDISLLFIKELNKIFEGRLSLAIEIFSDSYPRRFFHQLVSGQLDMDRLDYLRRDSFFTGVTEGIINSDRIISMLSLLNDEPVVEAKGIYSVEKFIIARRLMYWQVYLHKTVISAERLLVSVIRRATELLAMGIPVFSVPALTPFLEGKISAETVLHNPEGLQAFALIDDDDVFASLKAWQNHSDPLLAFLSTSLVNRKLFKTDILKSPPSAEMMMGLKQQIHEKFPFATENPDYLLDSGVLSNNAYASGESGIKILYRNGEVVDLAGAADLLNISVLSTPVEKYFLSYPKELRNK
jgi:HD superfamily phosphohydrolase